MSLVVKWRQTGIRLNRRFRSALTFTVDPGAVEAANAALPGSEHRAGILIRCVRVSVWLAWVIQWIQSRGGIGLMSDHNARAFLEAALIVRFLDDLALTLDLERF